jgi:hypothetical protein
MGMPGGITGGPCGGRGAGLGLCIGIREFDGIQDTGGMYTGIVGCAACGGGFHILLVLSVCSEASTTLSVICASFSTSSVSCHTMILLGGGHPSSSKAHAMVQLDVILVIRSMPVPLKVEAAAAAWLSRSR